MNNEDAPPIYHPTRENGSRDNRSGFFRRPIRHRLSARTPLSPQALESLKLHKRPCSILKFLDQDEKTLPHGWNEVLKTFLAGTRSKDSAVPLSMLRDHEKTIVRLIFSFLVMPYAEKVRLTIPAGLVGNGYSRYLMKFVKARTTSGKYQRQMLENTALTSSSNNGFVSFVSCGRVKFPEPANRKVNMLPFILGNKESLPEALQCYYPLVDM